MPYPFRCKNKKKCIIHVIHNPLTFVYVIKLYSIDCSLYSHQFFYITICNTHNKSALLLGKGANPQGVSTEIIIEIKQLNSSRMASHASSESIYMVYPLKDTFTIENGLLFV